jgi:hypothetical protein
MDETARKQALAVTSDTWMEQARQLLLAAPIAVSPAPSPAFELPPFHHTARAGATATRRSW